MKRIVLPLVAIFTVNSVFAQVRTISSDEFMAAVKEQSPRYRISSLEVDIAKEKIESASSVDDVTVNASTKYYYSENYQPSGTNLTESSSGFRSSASAAKRFSATGTEISAAFDQSVYTEHGLEDKDYYNPAVTLGISQPLLYNFLGSVDRFAKEDARISYEISKLQRQLDDLETENYYNTLYADWGGYSQIAALSTRHVANAETLYAQLRRKKNAGLVENDDVQEAYSSLLNYRRSRDNYALQLAKIEAAVEQVTGEGYLPEKDYLASRVKQIKDKEYPQKDFADTGQAAVINKSVEQLKTSRTVLENKLLPQLDLIASYTTKNLSENSEDILNPFAKHEYSVGFQMTYSFGNSSNKAAYRSAALSLEKISQNAKLSTDNYIIQRNSLIAAIDNGRNNLLLIERNIAALRSQLETQTKKYEQSRITLSTLLTTRNRIANAEIDLVSAQLALVALDNDYETLTR